MANPVFCLVRLPRKPHPKRKKAERKAWVTVLHVCVCGLSSRGHVCAHRHASHSRVDIIGWKEEAFFFLLVHACVRNGNGVLVSMEETCSGICPIKRRLAKRLEGESQSCQRIWKEKEKKTQKKVIDDGGFGLGRAKIPFRAFVCPRLARLCQ